MSIASVSIASASTVTPHNPVADCGGCGGGGDDGGGTSGGGGDIARLRPTGSCGDQLDMRLRVVGGPLDIGITIPSADPSEVWTITAIKQTTAW